jgi:FKBP-type peptidyl-prolyl cis-trans isomerase (trigger factor)
VSREIERKEMEYRERLKKIKLDEESYLKTLGTTFEDLKKGWRTEVEELLKSDLLLIDLALEEKKTPTDEEINSSVKAIQDPEAKRTYSTEEGKNYYRTLMIRENGKRVLLDLVKKIEE